MPSKQPTRGSSPSGCATLPRRSKAWYRPAARDLHGEARRLWHAGPCRDSVSCDGMREGPASGRSDSNEAAGKAMKLDTIIATDQTVDCASAQSDAPQRSGVGCHDLAAA
jgi:hypothetical protein